MRQAYQVHLYEFEKGWGNKRFHTQVFTNLDDAFVYQREENADNNKDIVPEYYIQAKHPEEIFITDSQYEYLQLKGNCSWDVLKGITSEGNLRKV